MLYYLLFFALKPHFSPLNVFRYITVRTAVASLTALLLSLLLGPWVIDTAARFAGEAVHPRGRAEGASEKSGHADDGRRADRRGDRDSHILWADLRNPYVLLAMGATLAFGTIGFIDDYNKVVRRRNLGLTPRAKFLLQVLTCVGVGAVLLVLANAGRVFDAVERAISETACIRIW